MKDQHSICIITGAGFSKPAGLPIAKEINSYFIRDNRDKILHFSSGENIWFDFANETDRNNGRLNDECIMWGYVLNQLVKKYIDHRDNFLNYEDFYQFVIDLFFNISDVENIFLLAKENAENENPYYSKDNQYYETRILPFNNIPRTYLINLINDLVGDLLHVRKRRDEIIDHYTPFIKKLINYKEINIVTLNHDLLIETIINKELNRKFSDGFTRNQNILFYGDNPLNVFQNFFQEDVTLIKLHGSIDMYKYEICDEIGSIVSPTGKYLYFKTQDFNEKQRPQRKNPDSRKILQTYHSSISPQFITGNRKDEIIKINEIYNSLFKKSSEKISTANELLIIGYSFADNHINEEIKSALNSSYLKNIIHINPNMKFPYKVPSNIKIQNLQYIYDI